MLGRLRHFLWGELAKDEIKKILFLLIIFLCITTSYAMLHPLKEAIFVRMVGGTFLPYVKMLSFLILIPILIVYGKLVDLFDRHKLFYILCPCYILLFITLAYLLVLPAIGLTNTLPDKGRLLGWFLYLVIESFSSLMFTLFWSFAISITNITSAQRGYPLIIAGSQVGSIAAAELVKRATIVGIPTLFIGATIFQILIMYLVNKFVATTQLAPFVQKKVATGPLQGLKLLVSRPYLMGIFAVTTFHEVVNSVIEYLLIIKADQTFTSTEHIVEFLGRCSQGTTTLTLILSFFGTGLLLRRLGTTFCLVLHPLLIGILIAFVLFKPSLWVLFIAIVAGKGLGYALNIPSKEILYLPTSKDIKFKTKSWIDGFGKRFAKTCGSSFNALVASTPNMMFFGSLFSLGLIGTWITIALLVGKQHERYTNSNTTLE